VPLAILSMTLHITLVKLTGLL